MPDDSQQPLPIRTHHCGEPIPDLPAIPESDWLRALKPLSPEGRRLAIDLAQTRADLEALGQLILDLPTLTRDVRSAADDAGEGVHRLASPPVDRTAADRRARRDSRQVSFRLTDTEYAELEAAGRAIGLRPTPLARMLAQNGARRILHEARSAGEV
jgi:hypothetical protein